MNDNPFKPNRDQILLRDPVKVSTKGAPKQNSRGRGKGGPDVTKMRDLKHLTRNLDENVAYAASQVITGAHAAKMKSMSIVCLC